MGIDHKFRQWSCGSEFASDADGVDGASGFQCSPFSIAAVLVTLVGLSMTAVLLLLRFTFPEEAK